MVNLKRWFEPGFGLLWRYTKIDTSLDRTEAWPLSILNENKRFEPCFKTKNLVLTDLNLQKWFEPYFKI